MTPETHLPSARLLIPIVRIVVHYIAIDAVQVQLLLLGADDGLRDHLRIAEQRLDVLVLIQTEIHIVWVHQHSARAAISRRLVLYNIGTGLGRWWSARSLVVGRCWCDELLKVSALRGGKKSATCVALR